MHPDQPVGKTDRIIRIITPLVVDRVRGHCGQIHPLLIGERSKCAIRLGQFDSRAGRPRVSQKIPHPQAEQKLVRLLRRRLDAEVTQQPAGGRVPQRDLFDLPQVDPVLRQDGAGTDPFEQRLTRGLLIRLRIPDGERGRDLLRRTTGHPLFRRAPKPDVARNELPGGRRRLRRVGGIGEQKKFPEGQRLPLHKFKQFRAVRLGQKFRRQDRYRTAMEKLHILRTHTFGRAPLDADFNLLLVDRGHRRELAMIEHQCSGIQ